MLPDHFERTGRPDPIDFRAYTVINIYEDSNAYWAGGPYKRVPRPAHRNYLGHLQATVEQSYASQIAGQFGVKMVGARMQDGVELRSRALFNVMTSNSERRTWQVCATSLS